MPKASTGKTVEDLQDLSLPVLELNRGAESRDFRKNLTYEIFAEQLQRKNPDRVLTKQTVDGAFTLVVGRMNRNTRNWEGRESALARVRQLSHADDHGTLLIFWYRYREKRAPNIGRTNKTFVIW